MRVRILCVMRVRNLKRFLGCVLPILRCKIRMSAAPCPCVSSEQLNARRRFPRSRPQVHMHRPASVIGCMQGDQRVMAGCVDGDGWFASGRTATARSSEGSSKRSSRCSERWYSIAQAIRGSSMASLNVASERLCIGNMHSCNAVFNLAPRRLCGSLDSSFSAEVR